MKYKLFCLGIAIVLALAGSVSSAAEDGTNVDVGLSPPDLAAFTLLGISSNKVSRPGTIKDFAFAFMNTGVTNGEITPNIGIEWSPAKTLGAQNLTKYGSGNWWRYTQVSFATGQDSLGKSMALGLRWIPWDRTDPLRDEEVTRAVDQMLNSPIDDSFSQKRTDFINNICLPVIRPIFEKGPGFSGDVWVKIIPFLRCDPDHDDFDPPDPRTAAGAHQRLDSALSSLGVDVVNLSVDEKQSLENISAQYIELSGVVSNWEKTAGELLQNKMAKFNKAKWNASVAHFAVGAVWTSADGDFNGLRTNYIRSYFGFTGPLTKDGLYVVHLEYDHFLRDDAEKSSSIAGGLRLLGGGSDFKGTFDIEVTNMGSDFNNDGYFDLCLATPSVGGTHSELVIYLGNGDGTFGQTIIRTPLGHVMANCSGDFNNDGNLDIAYVNGSEHYCAILFGNGDGTFTNELRYNIGKFQPIRVVCFDADSDADLDLVVASVESQTGASLFLLENQLDPEGFSAMPVLIKAEDNAELFLTSPSGQVVNKVRSSIASGEYQRRNSNQNNLLDDAISFNTVEAGVYTIAASPKPGAAKSVETFSLEITFGATPYRFADNAAMDPAGYEFNLYPSGGSPVSPPPGTWVYNAGPTLTWLGSGSFDIQLATDIEFANIIATSTVNGNSYQVSPLDTSAANLYYWRVKPVGQSEYETLYPFNLALVDCIRRGNIDHDPAGQIDISDLVYLVDYMFTGGPQPPNIDEGNVDSFGGIDISDLVYLVDYMFTGGPEPPACP